MSMKDKRAQALYRIAVALEAGEAPEPIGITTYSNPVSVQLRTRKGFEAWAAVFGLSPVDVIHDTSFMPEGETMMRLGNADVELKYIERGETE